MKIIAGQIELEITGSGKVQYDVNTDTLTLSAAPPVKRPPLMLKHEPAPAIEAPQGLTKTVLKGKILALLKSAGGGEVSAQRLTQSCLGHGATSQQKNYLKLLLVEMTEQNAIRLVSGEGEKRRWTIAHES